MNGLDTRLLRPIGPEAATSSSASEARVITPPCERWPSSGFEFFFAAGRTNGPTTLPAMKALAGGVRRFIPLLPQVITCESSGNPVQVFLNRHSSPLDWSHSDDC